MAPTPTLQQKANKYFAALNPLATKIYNDINEISDAYAHLWNGFNSDEQYDVINVTLIKPDIVLKYFNEISKLTDNKKEKQFINKPDNIKVDEDEDDDLSLTSINSKSYRTNFNHIYLYNTKDLCTYQQIITALKYNQDDLCGVYRDEHSEPFNSKTKSQMNLNFTPNGLDNVDGIKMKKIVDIKPSFNEADIKKDYLSELNSKFSTLKTDCVQQDSRKSFMSKLFSGTNVISQKSLNTNHLNHDDTKEVNINLVDDLDSTSTKSANSMDKTELCVKSRLIDKPITGEEDDDDDHYDKQADYDIPETYDFLSNW